MFSSKNRSLVIYWGLPQIPFISVALLAALAVGADFGHDTFVRVTVFFLVWFFINISYYLCQSILYTVLTSLWYKPHSSDTSHHCTHVADEQQAVGHTDKDGLYDCLSAYTVRKMSAYLNQENLHILLEDIRLYTLSPFPEQVVPVRTKVPVHPRDLKHFIWNIGIRLDYSGISKATFVKQVFAEELRNQSLETILRTLRQDGKCLIELDHPKPGSFRFSDDG